MGSTNYQGPSDVSFLVTVDTELGTWQTTHKFSGDVINGRSNKELAIESLEGLLTKLKNELATGNLS